LKHVPGTKIRKADGLSKQPDWKVGVENDNDNQIFIKNNWIYSSEEVVIDGPEDSEAGIVSPIFHRP